MDSHGDFNVPEGSPSGYIGGICLAMATGRGPKLNAAIELHRPAVREESLVHMGSRELDAEEEQMMNSSGMKVIPMATVRKQDISQLATKVPSHLADNADWLACHLDVDVIGR